MRTITVDDIIEHVDYNPLTGTFRRKTNGRSRVTSTHKIGDPMGYLDHAGYLHISVRSVKNPASRIAFVVMTGRWPEGQMDHIDRNRLNNKWDNLREVKPLLNQQNRTLIPRGKSGYIGVYFSENMGQWTAKVTYEGKTKYLGHFDTAEDASKAYQAHKEYFLKCAENGIAVEHDPPRFRGRKRL